MPSQPCDVCREDVRIAGGIGDFWSKAGGTSGGMTLELSDGSEHFLCFDCIDDLPSDRELTTTDVESL